MRILFMGTPEISGLCLSCLVEHGQNVVGVISQPDRPKGRGNIVQKTPTKLVAEGYGIPVYQPNTLRDDAFMHLLSEIDPEVIVVVAYGKILPKAVLDYPKYGAINVHASLLPKYRGAAPMQRAIMAGEKETGVTIMYMAEGLDTGDMLLREAFPIHADDNLETVHDRTAALGGELLLRVLPMLENGTAERTPQEDALATYAQKIEKEESLLELSRSAEELDRIIRGLSPIPLTYVYLPDGKQLKIVRARPSEGDGEVGRVLRCDDRGEGVIRVACGEGALDITAVLPEGKKKMTSAEFLRGRRLEEGDLLRGK